VQLAHDQLNADYGQAVAAEVAKQFASVLANATPALAPYLDTLPDYLARMAAWRHDMRAAQARLNSKSRSAAPPEVRESRQKAAEAAGGVNRGAANPYSKLTEDHVRSIRRKHAAGERASAIAAEFGISARTVNLIVCGQRWAHVGD
jgi:hypothetical protein